MSLNEQTKESSGITEEDAAEDGTPQIQEYEMNALAQNHQSKRYSLDRQGPGSSPVHSHLVNPHRRIQKKKLLNCRDCKLLTLMQA